MLHLLTIVDTLTTEPVSAPTFWTLKGVLAICAILVFLGWLTDWLFRRNQKEAILKKLSEFEDKLAHLPIRMWQVRIARAVDRFWTWLSRESKHPWVLRSKTRDDSITVVFGLVLTAFVLIGLLHLIASLLNWIGISVPRPLELIRADALLSFAWYSTVLVFLAIPFAIDWLYDRYSEANSAVRLLRGRQAKLFWGEVLPIYIISTWFTLAALQMGIAMGADSNASYWFSRTERVLEVSGGYVPFILSVMNSPFDLVTIYISLILLRWVASKGKYIVWIALFDIVVSGILVVLLHTTLKTVEPGGLGHIGQNFADSWNWFIQVVTFKASHAHPDWPLTPTLFTTFIPVTLYMSAFIFLGIIIKPFARAASYICGLLYEKQQTPFLAFSLMLSGLITVAKALSEWQWFVHQIKQLLG